MSKQAQFTPGRENTFNEAMQNLVSQIDGRFSHRSSPAYRAGAAAVRHAKRPCYSVRAPGWFFIPQAGAPELERGRRLVQLQERLWAMSCGAAYEFDRAEPRALSSIL